MLLWNSTSSLGHKALPPPQLSVKAVALTSQRPCAAVLAPLPLQSSLRPLLVRCSLLGCLMLQVPEALRRQLPVVVPAGKLPAAGQPCAAFFLPRAALLARLPNAAVPELPRPPACVVCCWWWCYYYWLKKKVIRRRNNSFLLSL